MRVVTLDWETYWDSKSGYTLTKMGPLEYVRDKRFYPQCFSVRIDHGETFVIPAVDGKDFEVLKALHLERPDTVTVGHNINGFDALILSDYYGIKPYMIVDTIPLMHWLGLSRIMSCSHKALTAALGHGIKQAGTVVSDGKRTIEEFTPEEWRFFCQYCHDDTYQCSENFFTMMKFVKNPDALKTMSLTAKMVTEPAFIPNGQMLSDYAQELKAQAETALDRLSAFLRFPDVESMLKAIRSRKQFPELLREVGGVCPMKYSEKQHKDIPAISKTDLAFTALLDDPNEKVRTLVQTRLEQNSSIQMSRTQSLLNFADKPIPIMLSAYKAHTGRYTAGNAEGSSDGLNFQNFSKRDPTKLALRKALKVPAGYKVVACDSSQIEARVLAWVSGQNDLIEQFRSGGDPYAEMASKIFGVPAADIHYYAKKSRHILHDRYKMYRNVGKTCILSCLGASTVVLTNHGLKKITKVTTEDKLWDGYDWVEHQGLVNNGKQKTIRLAGLHITPDHYVFDGMTWEYASSLRRESKLLVYAVLDATRKAPMHARDVLKLGPKLTKSYAESVETVYDIKDAGPRHCFTVLTDMGFLVVHNCGYGVGAQKFSDTLLRQKVYLDPEPERHREIAWDAHAIYRQSSYAITAFWKTCGRVLDVLASNTAMGDYGTFGAHDEFHYGRAYIPCTNTVSAYIAMPNGYNIWYPNLRYEYDEETQRNVLMFDRIMHGKAVPTRIFGGAATENVTQSLAFHMLAWQACRMTDAGVPIKANIHDAWIAVVPEDKAEETKATMEHIMSSVPEWLEGFPVGCEAEIGDDFTIA